MFGYYFDQFFYAIARMDRMIKQGLKPSYKLLIIFRSSGVIKLHTV
ncbi:hypothetical protein J569_1373 [Acinetobacter sp. 907131]|jgi:hypothetical protein|nr:hypothetical protein J569_1373 [Acinetobacter sp. 907131]EXS14101.1 hypothetical protein J672_2745 [Acinetobacter sp. 883425]